MLPVQQKKITNVYKAELNSEVFTSSIQTKLMPFGYKAKLNSEVFTSSIQTKLMPFGYKKLVEMSMDGKLYCKTGLLLL